MKTVFLKFIIALLISSPVLAQEAPTPSCEDGYKFIPDFEVVCYNVTGSEPAQFGIILPLEGAATDIYAEPEDKRAPACNEEFWDYMELGNIQLCLPKSNIQFVVVKDYTSKLFIVQTYMSGTEIELFSEEPFVVTLTGLSFMQDKENIFLPALSTNEWTEITGRPLFITRYWGVPFLAVQTVSGVHFFPVFYFPDFQGKNLQDIPHYEYWGNTVEEAP